MDRCGGCRAPGAGGKEFEAREDAGADTERRSGVGSRGDDVDDDDDADAVVVAASDGMLGRIALHTMQMYADFLLLVVHLAPCGGVQVCL